jgi:hypothetical protein
MTADTYWKIRALFALMQLAQVTLRDTTAILHQTLEQNGLPVDKPLRFDDLRQIIQEDPPVPQG